MGTRWKSCASSVRHGGRRRPSSSMSSTDICTRRARRAKLKPARRTMRICRAVCRGVGSHATNSPHALTRDALSTGANTSASVRHERRYIMAVRKGEFGDEKYCHQCEDWWPDDDEFFYKDSVSKTRKSPCKACIEEQRAKTNAVKLCCVPGCNQPRCHWRLSRCRTHQREIDKKNHLAAKARKAVRG